MVKKGEGKQERPKKVGREETKGSKSARKIKRKDYRAVMQMLKGCSLAWDGYDCPCNKERMVKEGRRDVS